MKARPSHSDSIPILSLSPVRVITCMGGVSVLSAQLTGVFLETLLIGLSIIPFLVAIYVLVFKRHPTSRDMMTRMTRLLLVATVFIFLSGIGVRIIYKVTLVYILLSNIILDSIGCSICAVCSKHSYITLRGRIRITSSTAYPTPQDSLPPFFMAQRHTWQIA